MPETLTPKTRGVLHWGPVAPRRGVVLARDDSGGRPASQPGPGAGGAAQRGRHILMIEDDDALATMYRRRLERDGHEVAVARTGRRGLDMLGEGDYDLVFLDLGLPDRDGLELLATVRKDWAQAPVIVLTNFSDTKAKARSAELGARAFVIKADVTPAWIAEQVDGWL